MFSPFGALGFLFGALLFFLLLVRNFFVQRSWYWSIQRGFGMGSRKALTTLFVGRFNCFTRHGESFFFSNSDKKDILGHWNLNLEGSDIRLLRLKRSSVVLTSNRPRLWLRLMGQSIMRSIIDRPILCLVFVNQDHNHQSHDSIQNPRSRKCKKRIFWRKISFFNLPLLSQGEVIWVLSTVWTLFSSNTHRIDWSIDYGWSEWLVNRHKLVWRIGNQLVNPAKIIFAVQEKSCTAELYGTTCTLSLANSVCRTWSLPISGFDWNLISHVR